MRSVEGLSRFAQRPPTVLMFGRRVRNRYIWVRQLFGVGSYHGQFVHFFFFTFPNEGDRIALRVTSPVGRPKNVSLDGNYFRRIRKLRAPSSLSLSPTLDPPTARSFLKYIAIAPGS